MRKILIVIFFSNYTFRIFFTLGAIIMVAGMFIFVIPKAIIGLILIILGMIFLSHGFIVMDKLQRGRKNKEKE